MMLGIRFVDDNRTVEPSVWPVREILSPESNLLSDDE
jgi:hypothetical protein